MTALCHFDEVVEHPTSTYTFDEKS